MTEESVQALIEKKPALAASREQLLAMKPGSYCLHRSWGFGKIKEFREADMRLIINFKAKESEEHSMDPAFCLNTMEILPEAHILVASEETPAEVKELINGDPAALLRRILEGLPSHSASPAEIERILGFLITPDKARKWLTSKKKKLAKDPSIGMPSIKGEPYVLRDQPVSWEDEMHDAFLEANSPAVKVKIAEELLEAAQAETGDKKSASEHLGSLIEDLATSLESTKQLKNADLLHAIFVRDRVVSFLGLEKTFEPQPEEILAKVIHIEELANHLPSAYQGQFLRLIESIHPDDWHRQILEIMKTSRGRFTSECVDYYLRNGRQDYLSSALVRWVSEQNLRSDLLQWIIKNRKASSYQSLLQPLINPRLFTAILFSIDYESLQSTTNRRVPLAELLSDDKELIEDLLKGADHETARDIANSLMINQGFEDLTKKSLMARIIKLYPRVQELLETKVQDGDAMRLLASQKSIQRLTDELEDLIQVQIPQNKVDIQTAKEHGDLKENAEYTMALQQRDVLSARRMELERDLAKVEAIDFQDIVPSEVSVGTVVTLQGDGDTLEYVIMGAFDNDFANRILSYQTPLAKSLMALKTGKQVTLDSMEGKARKWKITKISRVVDRPEFAHLL